jgi:hypothetical protein
LAFSAISTSPSSPRAAATSAGVRLDRDGDAVARGERAHRPEQRNELRVGSGLGPIVRDLPRGAAAETDEGAAELRQTAERRPGVSEHRRVVGVGPGAAEPRAQEHVAAADRKRRGGRAGAQARELGVGRVRHQVVGDVLDEVLGARGAAGSFDELPAIDGESDGRGIRGWYPSCDRRPSRRRETSPAR